jgi:NAD/NADP transhydrogenase beta subunit
MTRKGLVILLAVATGVALELGIHALSGRREAWDSPFFWTLGMPIAALMSVMLGFISHRNDWLWTAVIVPSQVTTMMVTSGEIGSLWPLAVVLSSILSAPFVAASFVGSKFRRLTVREAQ